MIEFQKKKKIKNILHSQAFLLALFILFIVLIKALGSVYAKEKLSIDNLNKEKMEFDKMSARKASLSQSISYLKTDDGVESEIRSKFRLVKEGESVAVIVGDDASSTPQANFGSVPIKQKSLIERIFGIFSK